MDRKATRRGFLGAAGAAAVTGWAGTYAAGARGDSGPGDTINLGLIGCGARGRFRFISAYTKLPGARFVAVCDVNTASYGYRNEEKLMGLEPALEVVESLGPTECLAHHERCPPVAEQVGGAGDRPWSNPARGARRESGDP